MRSFFGFVLAVCGIVLVSASAAQAGAHCPPGTYVARYSFGIWICKQPSRVRLACAPGQRLGRDHIGTPKCVWR